MQVSDAVSVNNTAELGEYWQRLVVFFSVRGCATAADDLASEVITRILGSLRAGQTIRDIGTYVYGVARNVRREYLRDRFEQHEEILVDPPATSPANEEVLASRLAECLEKLPPESRYLLLEFYAEGKNKRNRAALAARLRIGSNALYIRASRLRQKLRECVTGKRPANREG